MKVPYINLALQQNYILTALLSSIENVLKRGDFILGKEVEQFESNFAEKYQSRFAIGVNSGTDALVLTMKALGIGVGDEVITVPNSFLATTSSIVLAGAKPVFVDVGEDENINPALIEKAMTPNCKAILPVHLRGHPAKMDAVCQIAKKHNLLVIEDCAQAVGAKYKNQFVGTFGIAGCYSLHPLKNLNACGDGGVIVTSDESLYLDLIKSRNHGLKNRDVCLEWSFNSRLDTLQAAILNTKLKYLDEWNARRREIAGDYLKALAGCPIDLPSETEDEYCVYHAFVIQTAKRDELLSFLQQREIEAKIHYPIPIHLQDAAKPLGYQQGDFPVTERQVKEIISLPIYPELEKWQVEWVAHSIQNFFNTIYQGHYA